MSHSERDNPYTRAIAAFVCQLQANDIPAEVQSRIKLLILDSLGCALYGADLPWTRILQGSLGELDTTQAASVWGTAQRLSLPHAALINGTQIQGFELDDVHRQGVMHVGAVVLPGLLGIAESRQHMSGLEFLTAAVAGYEIGPRVGICMGPEHIAQGWHSGATLGVFSSAAGAARGPRVGRGPRHLRGVGRRRRAPRQARPAVLVRTSAASPHRPATSSSSDILIHPPTYAVVSLCVWQVCGARRRPRLDRRGGAGPRPRARGRRRRAGCHGRRGRGRRVGRRRRASAVR